jgi:hypothetical protein
MVQADARTGAELWPYQMEAHAAHCRKLEIPERIEQAIAADVEWLEAHPVRGSKRKPSNSGQEQ